MLNIEYITAEYYLRGVTGQGLTPSQTFDTSVQQVGTAAITVPPATVVNFSNTALQYYAIGLASDENAHVNLLRTTLINAGARASGEPNIDFVNGFRQFFQLAGLSADFNPFADQISFFLGAYFFEDLTASAYADLVFLMQTVQQVGAASSYLPMAAGILAAEGYHTGAVRGVLADLGGDATTAAISAARQQLSAGFVDKGTGADSNPFDFASVDDYAFPGILDVSQVLSVLFLNSAPGTASGGFFPNGLPAGFTIQPSTSSS